MLLKIVREHLFFATLQKKLENYILDGTFFLIKQKLIMGNETSDMISLNDTNKNSFKTL